MELAVHFVLLFFWRLLMSKLYDKYLILKKKDEDKLYLFRNGNFYIFLADDCDYINEYVVLKKTLFAKDVFKCGFPVNALDDYMHVFSNHKLNVEIIDNYEMIDYDENIKDIIFDSIKSLDIDNITPVESIKFLSDLKEKIK